MSVPNDKPIVPRPVLGQPGFYDVPSRSRPGTLHRVDANAPGSCTCESFTYHGYCAHLDVCCDVEDRVARQRAMVRGPRPLPRSLAQTAERCCTCQSPIVMRGTAYCAWCAPGVLSAPAVTV